MRDQPLAFEETYSLKKSCRKYPIIDPRNRRYLERHKERSMSRGYEQGVAKRRAIGTEAEFDFFKTLQHKSQDRLFTHLERLTKRGEIESFINTVRRIKWEGRRVGDFVRVIRLALNVSAPTVARHIFGLGMKYHPDSPQLSLYAKLFGQSPRASIRVLPANNTLAANREWLKENRAAYRSQWIALQNGVLIATGSSLDDLKSRVSDTSNVLLTRA
jgi:hypothetical protein